MESILTSIKKLLGIAAEITHFDPDIIIFINGALLSLNQLGVGSVSGFRITSESEKWVDLLGEKIDIEAVKTCVYLKVRLLFDPPSNSFLVEAIKNQIAEYEWRLNIQVDPFVPTVVEGGIVSE